MKTTRILTLPLLILSSVVLTACGGGSSSASGDNTGGTGGNGGSGGGSTNTVTLTASVVQSTVCNTQVPASSAELVVYDDNWAIKSRHKADANGNISAVIPQTSNVNISFIGTSGTGASRRIAVDSFAQHPIGDLGVFTIPGVSSEGCECQTTTLTVTAGQTMMNAPQLPGYDSSQAVKSYASYYPSYVFNNIKVCRASGNDWPTLYASTHYNESFKAAGYLSDYDPEQPLVLDLDQTPTTYSANVDYSATSTSVMHNFGDAYFSYSEIGSLSNIELFDDIPDLSAVSLRAYDTRIDYYDSLRVGVGRMQRQSVTPPYNSAVDVTLPNSQGTEQLLQTMLTWLSSDSNSYDLSGVSDFETFTILMTTTLIDGSSYSQNFYGPKRGIVPEDVLPADYGVDALLDEENITLYISMIRYGEQQSYQQYLASSIAASRMSLTERILGSRSQYNAIYVDISM